MQQQRQEAGFVAVGSDEMPVTPSNADLIVMVQPDSESQPSIFGPTSPLGRERMIKTFNQSNEVAQTYNFEDDSPYKKTYEQLSEEQQQQPTQATMPKGTIKQQQQTVPKRVTILEDPVARLPPKSQTFDKVNRRTRMQRKAPTPKRVLRPRPPQALISPIAMPGRRQQLYALLQQVETLQGKISRLPSRKDRHYFSPYIKLGQASNLNLNPQSALVAEKIVESELDKEREEIQKAAQLLLSQIEYSNHQHANSDIQCFTCRTSVRPKQNEMTPHTYICEKSHNQDIVVENAGTAAPSEIRSFNYTNNIQKTTMVDVEEANDSQQHQSSVQCDDCGHVGVTATENTSEAKVQVDILSLTPIQPSADQTWPPSIVRTRTGKEAVMKPFEDTSPISVKIAAANSSSNNVTKQERWSLGGSRKCAHCGSLKIKMVKKQTPTNHRRSITAQQDAGMPFYKRANSKNSPNRKKSASIVSQCHPVRRKSSKRTQKGMNPKPYANLTQSIAIKQARQQLANEGATNKADQDSSQMQQIITDGKDSSIALPKELHQINLQIRNRNESGLTCAADHAHSQPKLIHNGHLNPSRLRKSPKSKISSKSKSKRPIRLPNGNIICGKCVTKHPDIIKQATLKSSMNVLPERQFTMETDQVQKVGDYDDFIGQINLKDKSESDSLHGGSISELQPTRRVESDAIPCSLTMFVNKYSDQEADSNIQSGTDMVSDGDRKIQDSIQFTSQTASARLKFSFEEMSEQDSDQISEVLISELRAIAQGNFELSSELCMVSAQRSEESRQKSNRLNLLSMGAYTAKDFDGVALDAQSNIATDAQVSILRDSMLNHSEIGDKNCFSNTRAEANQVASGAYGSELEYSNSNFHQPGGYPLRQMVDIKSADEFGDDDYDDEEELEEGLESEFDEEMEEESHAQSSQREYRAQTTKDEDELDQNSHATSYSDWYVIDEQEEARLKQLAFEKYLSEQAVQEQMEKARLGIVSTTPKPEKKALSPKHRFKKSSPKGKQKRVTIAAGVIEKGKETIEKSQGSSIELQDASAQYTNAKDQSALGLYEIQKNNSTTLELIPAVAEYQAEGAVTVSHSKQISLKGARLPTDCFEDDKFQTQGEESFIDRGSVDAKSFQTGIKTLKAFRPERLYEEAPVVIIGINDANMSQKTRQVMIGENQRFAEDSGSIIQPFDLLPTSKQQSALGLSEINKESHTQKVKFNADHLSLIPQLQDISTIIPECRYFRDGEVQSLINLPNDYDERVHHRTISGDGCGSVMVTRKGLTSPKLVENIQSQINFPRNIQTSEQLLPTMNISKGVSQEEVKLTKFSHNSKTEQPPGVKEVSGIQVSLPQNTFDIVASTTELVAEKSDTEQQTQINDHETERRGILHNLYLNTTTSMDVFDKTSPNVQLAQQQTQKLELPNEEQLHISEDAQQVQISNDNADSNQVSEEAKLVVHACLDDVKDYDEQVASQLRSGDLQSYCQQTIQTYNEVTTGMKTGEQEVKVSSEGGQLTPSVKVQSQQQVHIPGQDDAGTWAKTDKYALSPQSQGDTRSRKSHRRKLNTIEMVDRSQQDSRCNRKEEVDEEAPVSNPTTQIVQENQHTAVILQPATQQNPSIHTQTLSRQPKASGQYNTIMPMPPGMPDPEPEIVQWVIVMGQRRPLTSSKPRAGRKGNFSPHGYVSTGRNDQGMCSLDKTLTIKAAGEEQQLQINRASNYAEDGPSELPHGDHQEVASIPTEPVNYEDQKLQSETADDCFKRMMQEAPLQTLMISVHGDEPSLYKDEVQIPDQKKSESVEEFAEKSGSGGPISGMEERPQVQNRIIDDSIQVLQQKNENLQAIAPAKIPIAVRMSQPQHTKNSSISSGQENLPYQIKVEGSRGSTSLRCNSIVDLPIEIQAPLISKHSPKHKGGKYSNGERSPNAYRINNRGNQIKSRMVNQSASYSKSNVAFAQRRPNASSSSYFNKQGANRVFKQGCSLAHLASSKHHDEVLQMSPRQSRSPEVSRNAIAGAGSFKTTNMLSNHLSPCSSNANNVMPKYMEQNDSLVNAAWNESTDKNLQKYVKKRTDQRLKEIRKECDEAKPAIFDKAYANQSSYLIEAAYLGNSFKSQEQLQKLKSQTISPNQTNWQGWDTTKIDMSSDALQMGRPEVPDRIDCLSNEGVQLPGNPPILVSSGIDPALQKYISGNGTPDTTICMPFEQKQKYMTLSKGDQSLERLENNTVVDTTASDWQIKQRVSTAQNGSRQRSSHFSNQYRHFTSQRKSKGKTSERRNIYVSANKRNHLTCDMYFHGIITPNDKKPPTQIERQSIQVVPQDLSMRFVRSTLVEDEKDRLNESFPNNQNLRNSHQFVHSTMPTQNDLMSTGIFPLAMSGNKLCNQKRLYNESSNSSAHIVNRLKNSYATSANPATAQRSRVQSSICGRTSISPAKKRLQFYPQTAAKRGVFAAHVGQRSGGGSIRLNSHLQQKQTSSLAGGFVEFNLIHDNQHAPFLGPRHLKTTAYL